MKEGFRVTNYGTVISGFWLWLILIINGDNGRDLLDVLIQMIGKM